MVKNLGKKGWQKESDYWRCLISMAITLLALAMTVIYLAAPSIIDMIFFEGFVSSDMSKILVMLAIVFSVVIRPPVKRAPEGSFCQDQIRWVANLFRKR